MKKILKKAELINTLADSVVIIVLIEKELNKMKAYITETYLYNGQGEEISQSTKVYTNYRTAVIKYSSLIEMLS